MGLIVQKFGGTSVGSIERIEAVAERVCRTQADGHQVAVVLSAMGGETDRLLDLAHQIQPDPAPRELDMLLATGEQVSIALLCMALRRRGRQARSYTGAQAGIRTDAAHNRARIQTIDPAALRADLQAGRIAVVAGFQGADAASNITTLGRGGSDTSAVALAAALEADECQIYTDVDGVYTTDPRVCESAARLEQITFEEMLEMASQGARVLQIRAVEFAGKYRVPLRVLSSFTEGPGTLISLEKPNMEKPIVSGVAFNRDEAKISILQVPEKPGVAARILGAVAEANIEVDVIIQNTAHGASNDLSFTVHRNDVPRTLTALESIKAEVGFAAIEADDKIAKVSLVGVGMRSHAGVASKMFGTLAEEGINIQMISTSEIKIAVIIDERYLELAVRSIHSAFGLDAQGIDNAVQEQENERI